MVDALTAPEAASPETMDTGDEPGVDRGSRRGILLATAAVALPILFAGIRGAVTGWIPTGDNAYVALRAHDVFSSHPPLLGTWSTASMDMPTGQHVNHLGPLLFDLLAAPVRVLGRGPGTAIGMAAINAVAVVVIAWLVYRRGGAAAAATAMGAAGLLAWSLGSEILYDPWNLHAALLPFCLFLVAVWCTASGDLVALPIMVFAGSLPLEIHLSYVVFVPALVAFGIGAVVLRLVRGELAGRAVLRWGALALVVGLLSWSQPLYQQINGPWDGNITALRESAKYTADDIPTPDATRVVRVVGGTLAVPPAWLPPSFGSPSFHLDGSGRPVPLAAGALVGLVAALGILGWRAHRRGATFVAAGCATGLVGIAAALATVWRMPLRHGLGATYVRSLWPLGMVVWLVLAIAVIEEIRRRRAGSGRRLALPGIALALVAGCALLPRVDNTSANPPWTVDAVEGIDDELVDGLGDKSPVVVEFNFFIYDAWYAPPVLGVLQDAGIPFFVTHGVAERQVGADRWYDLGDADRRIVVKPGRDHVAARGEELVASWERELTRDETDDLDRLTTKFRNALAEHGIVLTDDARDGLRELDRTVILAELEDARSDPDDTVEKLEFVEIGALGYLDPQLFPPEDLERWRELREIRDWHAVGIYLSQI